MEAFFVLIIIWFVVVITHAFTKVSIPPNKVTEVRFIERMPRELVRYDDQFIIDQAEIAYFNLNQKEMIERQFYKSKHRIVDDLPNELFEFTQEEDWRTNGIKCSTRLIIMPPKKY